MTCCNQIGRGIADKRQRFVCDDWSEIIYLIKEGPRGRVLNKRIPRMILRKVRGKVPDE